MPPALCLFLFHLCSVLAHRLIIVVGSWTPSLECSLHPLRPLAADPQHLLSHCRGNACAAWFGRALFKPSDQHIYLLLFADLLLQRSISAGHSKDGPLLSRVTGLPFSLMQDEK